MTVQEICRRFVRCGLFTAALLTATALPAHAAERYPTKPIRMISPFPAGGSVDLVARLIAAKLPESIGQQVVVENRSGASGNIGTEVAARAAPDGYTLLVNTIPFVANAFLYSKLPYDPLNDFVPVMQISSSPPCWRCIPRCPRAR
jgi:tripartite-type tricarboxylate transporter receptor subunit TctC